MLVYQCAKKYVKINHKGGLIIMGVNKMIARAMSKSGGRVKMIPSNDKYLFSEWEKWLSYEPEFENSEWNI